MAIYDFCYFIFSLSKKRLERTKMRLYNVSAMKKINKRFLSFLLSVTALCSCNGGGGSMTTDDKHTEEPDSSETGGFQVGEDYHRLAGVEEDIVNGFYDGFEKLDKNNWSVLKGYWGANNGGVSPENVAITEDGTLALGGNGLYYSKNDIESFGTYKDGRKCGASLISNFVAKPGHYEIRMKVHPRIGSCTAFWTYGNRPVQGEENENAEIDVELPGGSKSGKITFKKSLYTNWITEKANDSVEIDAKVADPMGDTIAYNDGKWHTFGFDWYTDPAMVVYFVDGKISNVSTTFVPTLAGRLWVGVWFPNGFTGVAQFEKDYMFVDSIQYTPFLNQPCTDFDAVPSDSLSTMPDSFYERKPIKTPVANRISNGDFEFVSTLSENESEFASQLQNKGFEFTKKISEKQALKDVCYVEKGTLNNTYSAFVKDGGVLRQSIEAVYDNYSFDYSFQAKSADSNSSGTVSFLFYGDNDSKVLKTEKIDIKSDEVKTYTGSITAPEGCEKVVVEARASATGSKILLDNLVLRGK